MDKKISNTEVKGLISKLRNAADTIKSQIHEIDQRIEKLFSEKGLLEEAQLTKEDFMFYVREDIRQRAANYPNRLRLCAKKTGFPFNVSFSQLERNIKSGTFQPFPYLDGETAHNGSSFDISAIYWLFGEQIEQRFSDAIDQFKWPVNSMTIEERRKRIAEIDAELEQLEEERNSLASDLMSTGMTH